MKTLKNKIATSLASLALILCLVLATFFSVASVNSVNAVAVTATVTVGATPLGVVYDSSKGEVFASNSGTGSLSVISDTTNAVVASVGVGSAPLGLAYDSGKGEIWVSNSQSSFETVVSDSTNTALTTVTVTTAIAAYPLGACYDGTKGEIYVACGFSQNVAVVSDSTNTVLTTIALANPSYPTAAAYDSAKGEIFTTNQQINTVSVISDSSNTVVANINVGTSPQSLCYDPAKGEIFVANFGSSTVSVISDATNTVVATVNVGTGPSGMAYDSGQGEVWVTNQGSNSVTVISDANNAVVGSAGVGRAPSAVAYDSGKNEIFVANSADGTVSVLSDSGPFPSPTATLAPAPPMSIPTWMEIQVSPNPVGVGQPIYMQAFLDKPTPTAGVGGVGDLYHGLAINITAPDGTVTHMGPYTADVTGGIPSLEFTPTKIGNYSFQAFYPGQIIMTAGAYFGDLMEPASSSVVVVTVQQTPISTIQSSPLPTAYWDFPIEATNYGWSVLAGDWLGGSTYDATSNFNPYTTAPTTAHIMWTKQTSEGGQPGGPAPGDEMHNFMTTSILVSCWDGIIMQGVLYYEEYNSMRSVTSWNAIDLRTGQLLWSRAPGIGPAAAGTPSVAGQTTAETLSRGSVYSQHSMQEYGSTCVLFSSTGTTWRIYSAFDGTYLGNITGVINPSVIRDENTNDNNVGEMLGYFISSGNLTLWNETLCFAGGITTGAGPMTLRPPTTVAFSAGDQWNVTVPTTINGNAISPALSIAKVTQDVILLRSAPVLSTQSSVGWEIDAGMNARTGALMWITNNTVPYQHSVALGAVNNDVFVLTDKDDLTAYGFSMLTGKPLWGPTSFPGSALTHLAIQCDAAYNQIYIWDIGGYCSAINLTSGKLSWTYYPPSAGYNTPYGVYPIWTQGCQAIGDGMLFLGVGRLYDPPLFENATRIALNCTTGKAVWGVLGFDSKSVSPVGDGFLVTWNCYDATIDTFGQGPSQITASVQNNIISLGNSILITGRVLDVSPGTQQPVQKYDFPDGVPCVPDSEMSDWMAHVYMQQPMPANMTGVPVTISVLDSNGNYRSIGTTTSDATDGLYHLEWTPDISGSYVVYANYGGSASYWPSSTETAFVVNPAGATTAPTATPLNGLALNNTLMYGIVAIIIVIVIIGAILVMLMLRKRP
ncbi:MAG: hypothetical protein ABSF44_06675 [Candidatus Bathyarchaeia archaeon]